MTTPMTRSGAAGPAKTARLDARITEEQKRLFTQAASIQGRSVTDFIVASSLEAAKAVVRDHELMTLTGHDREAFVQSLLQPPAPGKRLRQAAERYKGK